MALVTVSFEDGEEGEQLVTYDSSRGMSLDSNDAELTPAESLAALAVRLLTEHLSKEGAEVEFQRPDGVGLN
jgi:hypothetical protein